MTQHTHNPDPLPPHLSMDEYAEFVATSLLERDPHLARRQKEFEEQINKPFSMHPRTPVAQQDDI